MREKLEELAESWHLRVSSAPELRIGCAGRGFRRVGTCGYVHENIMYCILYYVGYLPSCLVASYLVCSEAR
jgi:hypothetical protein